MSVGLCHLTLNRRVRYPGYPTCSGQPINRRHARRHLVNLRQAWALWVEPLGHGILCGSDINLFATLQKSQQVSRAGYAQGAAIEHVRIDHGGLEIGVAQ